MDYFKVCVDSFGDFGGCVLSWEKIFFKEHFLHVIYPKRKDCIVSFDVSLWKRFECEGVPVYFRKDRADWLVPSSEGDAFLKRLESGDGRISASERCFLERLPGSERYDYPGRSSFLRLEGIRELWFHITDRCNLACTHCLFSSSADSTRELEAEEVIDCISEARKSGCRVFAFTGGEPFVHPRFKRMMRAVSGFEDTHFAVLTNGMLMDKNIEWMNALPKQRFHLQISVDGNEQHHDSIRGQGTFAKLREQLAVLKENGFEFTLSMCVTSENAGDMTDVVAFAAECGAPNVHFMWYFIRGRGKESEYVNPANLAEPLWNAYCRGKELGVSVDNVEAMKTQVFAPAGTIHDGANAGWESLAVGPDEKLYPTPALVGCEAVASSMGDGLVHALETSSVFETLRSVSVAGDHDPMRFILGGGDPDHSYMSTGDFSGYDPYTELYRFIALRLIAERVKQTDDRECCELRLKMGDMLESCGAHGSVAMIHTNCLLAVAGTDARGSVKNFYSRAAKKDNEGILNPVCYPEEVIAHVPAEFRFRGYGCGSPVDDAELMTGETVVDLGCGTGMECFIAAKKVGVIGRVIGVDMLDPMLERAEAGRKAVERTLGYKNLAFKKGYLESLPVADEKADAVVSNCVLNLSVDKRKAFGEVFRVLRSGGRLVVSDVVCEEEPDAAIRNDEGLKGECIGGALSQADLFGILEETGFANCSVIKRFPYRTVNGHPFYSLTFAAYKPAKKESLHVMYRGPFAAVLTHDGELLKSGISRPLSVSGPEKASDSILLFDDKGSVTNLDLGAGCCCAVPAAEKKDTDKESQEKFGAGCMVCGADLMYSDLESEKTCTYCGNLFKTSTVCENGCFVCDSCHAEDAVAVIRSICAGATDKDMFKLFNRIRRDIPMHGPEHHVLVAAVILTAYRNAGGTLTQEQFDTAMDRAGLVPGGSCGYMGVCGAATGVGIAFGTLLESTPIRPVQRNVVQSLVCDVLAAISEHKGARCCRREGLTALKKAAELSKDLLPVSLEFNANAYSCNQRFTNPECIHNACPWALNH